VYVKSKSFHWRISGRHFRDDHPLLDDHATQIFTIVDDIAERVRMIGGTALGSMKSAIQDNDDERLFDNPTPATERVSRSTRPAHVSE
jgi:DNA-binding ferritin-like protein